MTGLKSTSIWIFAEFLFATIENVIADSRLWSLWRSNGYNRKMEHSDHVLPRSKMHVAHVYINIYKINGHQESSSMIKIGNVSYDYK